MFPDVRFLYCSTNKNLILSLSIYLSIVMYIPVSFCPICLKMTNVTFCRDFLSLTYCHVTFCPTFKLWTTHLVKKYWTKDRNIVSLNPLIGTLTTRLSAEDCFRQWTKRERKKTWIIFLVGLVWLMVFITTFNNISVIP